MKHIELHILDTEQDALLAENTGLTTFATFEYCSNCEEQIAFTANTIDKITIIQSDELDSYWKSVEYDWIKVDII